MAAPRINQSTVVDGRLQDVDERLQQLAGVDGYALLGQTPQGLTLRRRRIPAWAIVLAVVVFPFGLLFLLVRSEEIVTIELQRVYNGTQVRAVGRASAALQRALQGLLGQWRVAGVSAPPARAVAAPPPVLPEAPPALLSDSPPRGTPVAAPLQAMRVESPAPGLFLGPPGGLGGPPGGVSPKGGPLFQSGLEPPPPEPPAQDGEQQ